MSQREVTHGKRREDRKKRRASLLKSGKLSDQEKIILLTGEVQALQAELRDNIAHEFSATEIKSKIFQISEGQVEPPKWLLANKKTSSKTLGIPTIFASDWHYGEKVFPAQIEY